MVAYLPAMAGLSSPLQDTVPFTESQHKAIELECAARRSNQEQSTPIALGMTTDILHIIPLNRTAKRAFSELAEDKTISIHHKQFLVNNGKGILPKESAGKGRSSGETTEEASESEEKPEEITIGYWRLNFDCKPLFDGMKWVMGRGSKKYGENRDVDILLAKPRPGSPYTRNLSAAHAFLQMKLVSGSWLIYATLEKHAEHKGARPSQDRKDVLPPVILDGHDLWHGEFRCLFRNRTVLEIADMQYGIKFAIKTPDQEKSYREIRDRKLRAEKLQVPMTNISGIPFESDMKLGETVWRHGLGAGSSGLVFEGFDIKTGDLRAIKRLSLKNESASLRIQPEIDAGKELSGKEGIVTLVDWRNSLGGNSLLVENYPIDAYIIMEKGVAFNETQWPEYKDMDWNLNKALFQQLLTGLATIHGYGWMHRDINIPQTYCTLKIKSLSALL